MFQNAPEENPKETTASNSNLIGNVISTEVTTAVKTALKSYDVTEILMAPFKIAADIAKDIFHPDNIFGRLEILDKEQARLRSSLGLGSQKADEFRKMVADGASSFALLGESVDKVGETYLDLVKVFKTDVSTTTDNLTELLATEKVTGQQVDLLAGSFRNVGVSINEVGENMMEVTEVARQAGVSVGEVSKQVVTNLAKMNIYNFEGGVKGLAKMSAQAAKLGIDMSEIFKVVDKVFNPEGAIELAASMQRLGVSTNALLDPLRLMDLSQNDPTELQNQIVNMSKDFVRFNKELGQFEIMPGEKRRLNEIGGALGLASGELQKMAINAANLDMKMKQIRFPSSIASKEDRELIATLAQVNKQGVAEIKVARLDEQGNKTGEYDMVEASQLTTAQLEAIKKDQELRGQSMEEIAFDQLDEQKKLNANFESLSRAVGYGISTSTPFTTTYDIGTRGSREFLFGDKPTNTQSVVGLDKLPNKAKDYRELSLEDIKKMFTDLDKVVAEKINNISFGDIEKTISDLGVKIKDVLGDSFDYATNLASEFGIGGSETDPLSNIKKENVNINQSLSSVEQKISSQSISQNLNAIEFKPIDINENIKVDVNVTMDPNLQNQALTTLISQGVEKWFTGTESNNNINLIRQRIMDVENRYNLTGPRLTNKE